MCIIGEKIYLGSPRRFSFEESGNLNFVKSRQTAEGFIGGALAGLRTKDLLSFPAKLSGHSFLAESAIISQLGKFLVVVVASVHAANYKPNWILTQPI